MSSDSISLDTHLSDLRPHTEYTISVVPINQNGMGDPSQEIKVKTYSSTPSDPPSNVTVEATSSTVSGNLICNPKHLSRRPAEILEGLFGNLRVSRIYRRRQYSPSYRFSVEGGECL